MGRPCQAVPRCSLNRLADIVTLLIFKHYRTVQPILFCTGKWSLRSILVHHHSIYTVMLSLHATQEPDCSFERILWMKYFYNNTVHKIHQQVCLLEHCFIRIPEEQSKLLTFGKHCRSPLKWMYIQSHPSHRYLRRTSEIITLWQAHTSCGILNQIQHICHRQQLIRGSMKLLFSSSHQMLFKKQTKKMTTLRNVKDRRPQNMQVSSHRI